MHVEVFDARAPEVAGIWQDLEQAARPGYFLSWGWLENWLACLPPQVRPELVLLHDGSRVLCAFFSTRSRTLRHGVIPTRERSLNASGIPRFDEICAEHNAVLALPGVELGLQDFVDVLPEDWDELALPALSASEFPGRALGEPLRGCEVAIERRVGSPFVDLARVRATPGGYVSLLSPSTRAQIRRAERGLGKVELEVAETEKRALEIYDELVRLHAATWRERGERGAFADPWFERFHRRLIGHRFDHGEIQLARVSAGGTTVGCLYNFVIRGRVLFYQSGLSRLEDPRQKPGYVCHAALVRHDAGAGHASYDFLGGESRYKQSLSTDRSELVWARIQRPLARFAIEKKLLQYRRELRDLASSARTSGL